MKLYRFTSQGWKDGFSFEKPLDVIMDAKEIESFIDSYPRTTFKVTTLMSEDEYKRLDPRWFTNFYMVESSDPIFGIIPNTVYKNSKDDTEINSR